MSDNATLRLALPSKGQLEQSTLELLARCGLKVQRPNERQYTASIPALPAVEVLFQRAPDVVAKVDEGSVDLGITGFDLVAELSMGRDHIAVLYEGLGYGRCQLVLAVPEGWFDVSTLEDLADLSLLFRDRGRELKIATKYPNLTRSWLYERGIFHFSLVEAQGALEAAPGMGYADMIADITSSGTTLRENRLKQVGGGTLLTSQACLIGNRRLLEDLLGSHRPHPHDEVKLGTVRAILELLEAHLRARTLISVSANMRGESPEAVARAMMRDRELAGLRGPTVSRVYSKVWGEEDWYAVNLVVQQDRLVATVDHLRRAGAADIVVTSPNYVFEEKSWHYEGLRERLRRPS